MIHCVVFDFDGTLVDSNAVKRSAFFEVTRAHDLEGEIVADVLRERLDRYQTMARIAERLAAQGQLLAPDQGDLWAEAYGRICEDEVTGRPEIPGASALLGALQRRGLPLYVASATPSEPLRKLVQRRGMEHHFRAVYGRPASKREILTRIASECGLAPTALLMVGDGEDDRIAARDFGCSFAGLVVPGSARSDGNQIDASCPTISSLAEVLNLLGPASPVTRRSA